MNLESPKTHTSKSQEELYNFLGDVNNFKALMPESLESFKVLDENSFLFQLKGMPEIVLELKDKTPHNQIVLGAKSDKLPFTLTANIEEAAGGSDVQLLFDGQFNAMMAMMIKGPIKKFIGTLSENMATV